MTRPLTEKEQKVIAAFESAQPGLGKLTEADIKATNGAASNSFLYRRIGG